jgi:hypothetical protein
MGSQCFVDQDGLELPASATRAIRVPLAAIKFESAVGSLSGIAMSSPEMRPDIAVYELILDIPLQGHGLIEVDLELLLEAFVLGVLLLHVDYFPARGLFVDDDRELDGGRGGHLDQSEVNVPFQEDVF